jgi:ADP-ribose pyrophosphatase YjhB (NUDIX family)
MSSTPSNADVAINHVEPGDEHNWKDVLPYRDGSHNSAKVVVPAGSRSLHGSPFHRSSFQDRLKATVTAARELGKSSIWVDVPLSRGSLLEDMADLGFAFHHAQGDTASLNLWLKDTESKVPEFATHHVGVGAVVVNTRNEILCVRELRKNYMPWKIPGGLSDLGEQIPEAAVREVLEETGIPTRFQSILSFRQTHGLTNGRSDLFFVCKLSPIEENGVIPKPIPQESEIEAAEWIPLSEYQDLVYGRDGGPGHPMMRHVMDVYEEGFHIKERSVQSVVPGRAPNSMYHPCLDSDTYLN